MTSLGMSFPWGSTGKESTCNAGDLGSIPELGRSYGEDHSGLENSVDCIVDGVAESDATEQLSLSLYFSLGITVQNRK